MTKLTRIIRRAANASSDEWFSRSSQAMFQTRNWANSLLGASVIPSNGVLNSLRFQKHCDLVDWWSTRSTHWFPQLDRYHTLQRELKAGNDNLDWIMQQAKLVCDGYLPIFDHGPIHFEHARRWHHDFILNKTSPDQFYGSIRYLDAEQVGDSKFTWEPNRFAWALWLGIAYELTNEDCYAERFCEWTSDWFKQNPYPRGINYCSALEIGIRNYAWVWTLVIFSNYLANHAPELIAQMIQGIWCGCHHIERNLSTYFSPNTHLTGEAFSLFACAAALPEFQESPRWRRMALAVLESESSRQFYKDGMHAELSSGYHVYSTDFYLHTLVIAERCGLFISERIRRAAKEMALRLAELAPADAILPAFNDGDGGRLLGLSPLPLDARPGLQLAQSLDDSHVYLEQPQPLCGASLLLLRNRPAPARDARPVMARIDFTDDCSPLYDSGIAAGRSQEHDYLLFRATPFGLDDCPHSHDAPLSVIVHLGGHPVFVDSGTGSYTQDIGIRNQFRTAASKNVLLLDDQGPSQPADWFGWHSKTNCRLVHYQQFADGFEARGKHTGYSNQTGLHVFVHRHVMLLNVGVVVIVDRWDANHVVAAKSRFTLHPSLEIDDKGCLIHRDPSDFAVHFQTCTLDVADPPTYELSPTVYSPNYGTIAQTKQLVVTPPQSDRGTLITILSRVGSIRRSHSKHFYIADQGIKITVQRNQILATQGDLQMADPSQFHDALTS